MKRALWIIAGGVLIGLGALFAFASYVLSSEWGLAWALQRARPYIPGELAVQSFHGSLRGPIRLEGVVWRNEGTSVEIDRIELEWEPLQLLHGEVRVARLDLNTVKVQPPATTTPRPEISLTNLVAPLTITVRQGVVSSLTIGAAPGRADLKIERLGVDAQWSGDTVKIEQFELQTPAYNAQISGHITTRDAYPLALRTRWNLHWPEQPELSGEGEVKGDLTRIQFVQALSEPVTLNVEGTVTDVFKTPQWELRAVGTEVDLRRIDTRWTLGAFNLDASARSVGGAIQSQGSVRGAHAVTGPFVVSWNGRYEKSRITMEEITVQVTDAGTQVRAQASVALNPQAPNGIGPIAVQGHWTALRWPLRENKWVSSATGEFSLTGTTDEYRFALSGPVSGENIPAGEIKLAGVGRADEVTLHNIDIATLGGTLHGDAALQWGKGLRWQARLRGTQLNPGVRWSAWPGRLSLAANADGEIRDAHVLTNVELTKLGGVLRGYPLQAQTRVTLDDASYTVHRAELRSGKSRLRAHGTLTDRWTLDWDVDAPDIAALYPELSGTISGNGTLRGPRATPHIQYAVQARNVHYQSVRVGQLDSRGDVDLDAKQPTTLSARAANIEVSGWRADTLQFNLDGALEAHRAVVTMRAPDSSADIALSGRWVADAWSAQLERAAFTVPRLGHWSLDAPVALSAHASAARWANACWRGAAGHVCTQGMWARADGVDAQVTLAESSLSALQSWLPDGLKWSGGLNASLHVRAPPPEQPLPLRAELRAQLAPGQIVVADVADEPLNFEHRGGAFNLLLDAQGARAEANVDFAQLGQVVATAQLPGWKPGTAPREQALTGSVRADVRKLGFLSRWLPAVERIQGALKADVRVAGTLAQPRFDGDVTLRDGAAALPQLGIKLSRVNIEVRQHSEQRVEFHATASSGPGSLDVRGDVILDRAAGWPVTLEVTGKEFETVNLPEAWVLASPELSFSKVRNRIDLGGVLQIPQARYTARDVSGALSASSDVVMSDAAAKTQKDEKWQIYTAVRFVFGDKVSFNGFGLKGLVRGEVVAMDEPKKLTTGYGELQIVDATFNAYKIDLKVTRGRLLFAGGPINNPGIDARAIREAGSIRQTAAKTEKGEALREPGAVIAGVLVRGTLRKLELTLFSEPPRDQADVLSLLLFGVPLGDATSEEGKALFIAASSLRLTGRDETLRKIGRRFGIDEIRLDAGSTPEQASLVIGRYLGPRLYVNYSVGLISTGSNVLRVRYRVSDKWMLQSEQSDAESAADLLYTFER